MKYIIAILLSALLAGCYTIKPGADPVVVHAEQLAVKATDTIDEFILFVDRNPGGVNKDVVAARNLAAESGPIYIRTLRSLTKTYKASRGADDKAKLQGGIAALEQLLAIIKENATK